MPAYLNGGSSALSTTLTTFNSSGFDRYLVVHVAASSSAALNLYLDAGTTTRILANYALVSAAEVRDFGPYYLDDSFGLRGNTYSPTLGSWYVDEERP